VTAIRLLSPADLPALLRLSQTVCWNQTAEDWARLIALEPRGCFGIDVEGTLAATATVICYRPDLAWLGMVLTLPEFRGRGFAHELVQRAVGYAGRRTIRLDASDMGHALYRSLGFVDECTIERWERGPGNRMQGAGRVAGAEFHYDRQLDGDAFGADRSALIEALSAYEASSIPHTAFALGRPGANATYFGPCVSLAADAARHLAEWFVALHPGESMFWDLFPYHEKAVEIARGLNFCPVRRLTRMSLNAVPGSGLPDSRIYAIAGFEYG
jgi:GNAT superfamily N-acetyltransferase